MTSHRVAVIAVIGSRQYPHPHGRVQSRLIAIRDDHPEVDHWLVVSGGAAGVDMAAKREAQRLGMRFYEYPPDYATYGDAATHIRNQYIIHEVPPKTQCNVSRVIAFWDMESTGTRGMIRKSIVQGRAVEVWGPTYEPVGREAVSLVFETQGEQETLDVD